MKISSRLRVLVAAATLLLGVATFAPGAAAPAAAATNGYLTLINNDGRVEQFWIGSDCQLRHRWQSIVGGPMSPSYSLGNCLISNQGIDGAANADGRLEVFGIGQNNDLVHVYQLHVNGAGGWVWGPSLGGNLAYGPTVGIGTAGALIVYSNNSYGTPVFRYQTAPSCCWDTAGWIPY